MDWWIFWVGLGSSVLLVGGVIFTFLELSGATPRAD